MSSTVSEIIANKLWLGAAPLQTSGDMFGRSDTLPTLICAGITHIVNCTPNFPIPTTEELPSLVDSFRVAIEDVDDAPIETLFEDAASFIAAAIAGGGRVYVHCETGKSRSATIVLAYRALHRGDQLLMAYNDTKAKREYIAPKVAFVVKLAETVRTQHGDTSLNTTAYALEYLQGHFKAYEWAGVDFAAVQQVFEAAGKNYAKAHDTLAARVAEAMK